MVRYRLRYLNHELELPMGDFFIGRSPECQLALDDPLVSRKHARLEVGADRITLHDLGSRNGVLVNGLKKREPVALFAGDRIIVGGQELSLVRVAESKKPTANELLIDHRDKHTTLVQEEPETRRASAFTLLFGVAEKALALGKIEDAERIVGNLLSDFLSQLGEGRSVDVAALGDAGRLALRLAHATGKASWVDWVFESNRAAGRVLDGPTIDELHGLVRRTRYPATTAMRQYVGALQAQTATMGPAERFLLKRLEGLLEVASAN